MSRSIPRLLTSDEIVNIKDRARKGKRRKES